MIETQLKYFRWYRVCDERSKPVSEALVVRLRAFGSLWGCQHPRHHGFIDEKYVDYCRNEYTYICENIIRHIYYIILSVFAVPSYQENGNVPIHQRSTQPQQSTLKASPRKQTNESKATKQKDSKITMTTRRNQRLAKTVHERCFFFFFFGCHRFRNALIR